MRESSWNKHAEACVSENLEGAEAGEPDEIAGEGSRWGRRRLAETSAARGGKNRAAPPPQPSSGHVQRLQRSPMGSMGSDPRVHTREQRRPSCRACTSVFLPAVLVAIAAYRWFSSTHGHFKEIAPQELIKSSSIPLERPGIFRQGDVEEFEGIFAQCRNISDTRNAPLKYLSEALQLQGDRDEWGNASPFLQASWRKDARLSTLMSVMKCRRHLVLRACLV